MPINLALGKKYANATNMYAQLINTNGVNFGDSYNTGFVHLGDGNFIFTGIIPYNFRGGIKFYSGNDLVHALSINPETYEYKDVKVSSRCNGISVGLNPFANLDEIEVRLIDDYFAAEGRSIDITSDNWPSLNDSVNTFDVDGNEYFSKYMIILNSNTLRVELSKNDLMKIGGGRWSYEVRSILPNNHIMTLTLGNIIVVPPFGD